MKGSPAVLQALRAKVSQLEKQILAPTTPAATTEFLKVQRHHLLQVAAFIEDPTTAEIDLNP